MPLEHTVIHSHMPSNKSCAFRVFEIAVPMQSGSGHAQGTLQPQHGQVLLLPGSSSIPCHMEWVKTKKVHSAVLCKCANWQHFTGVSC